MPPTEYKRIVLNERPVAHIEPSTFRTEALPFDLKAGEGEVVMQITWAALLPAMRSWLWDVRSYLPPIQIGEVVRTETLGVVIEVGSGSSLSVGDIVYAFLGLTEYAVVNEKAVQKIDVPEGAKVLDFLSALGSSGMTAYFGLKDIGQVKSGETLVVSGAAGSVGVIACQLGKRAGAKVYGIAGSQEKCEYLEKEIGIDGALNYKSPTFQDDFKKIGYLDVFFDNVGGDILDFALTRLNKDARIVLSGAISIYNEEKPKGLQNYMDIIAQRAKLQGIVIFDFAPRFPEAFKELAAGLADGSIKRKFHAVLGGIEEAPKSIPLLFNGGNTGKLVVQVSDEERSRL